MQNWVEGEVGDDTAMAASANTLRISVAKVALQSCLRFSEMVRPFYSTLITHCIWVTTWEGCDLWRDGSTKTVPEEADNIPNS